MYYSIEISHSDKIELDSLLDRYVKKIGEQMAAGSFTTCGELQAVGNDLDLVMRIRTAIESAEEVPQGKE